MMACCVTVAPVSVPLSVAPSVQFVALWVALQSLFVPFFYPLIIVCLFLERHIIVVEAAVTWRCLSPLCYGAGQEHLSKNRSDAAILSPLSTDLDCRPLGCSLSPFGLLQ